MLASKVGRDRVHQDWEGGYAPQAARLAQRENPLHPAIPLGIEAALHQLAPQDGKPQRPLRAVIGGFDSILHDKRP